MGIRKANNIGLVSTTIVATGNVCHTMPTASPTTVVIRKIMWSNNTGAPVTLIFGTRDNVAPAGWVPLFPTITCINSFDGELTEEEIPEIEFAVDGRAGVAGMTGDIAVLASAAGVLVRLEVEEFREGR